ncbi:dipeptide epimerase [Natronorubrum tibetense]|uniref:Mandelate racemase/muconate lactonizing protein n=1 Tax=Natronorubrum tibetense GA33 TaxID=1114856 RepID=L9VP64_9EURY|nr:dipeptide epimerase [Natronorubrum tibetense]ELY38856.1 mandelate racemase/muconate lactonizing protein [Natronorubrum tibetense GA33]
MIVDRVDVYELELPLTDSFEISLGSKHRATNVLVELETESGVVGWGEGAPLEPITGETVESAVACAKAGASILEGRDLRDRRGLVAELDAALPGAVSSRFALETALYDAYCRERGIALAECFGGKPEPVRTDLTVSIVDPETAAAETNAALEAGFDEIKVKVGGSVDSDLERVAAVRDAAPDAEIKVDANQGWTPKEAIRFAHEAGDRGFDLELLEQPVHRDDVDGLRRVTETVRVPVAADEAVFTPADAHRIAAEGAADVINIKAAKSGLTDGAAIAEIARGANLEVMIGCMLESALGLHASAHLVAGLGDFSYVDLDGNLSFERGIADVPKGPTHDLSGPGHGIVPDPAVVPDSPAGDDS